jgi:hypothetical protein
MDDRVERLEAQVRTLRRTVLLTAVVCFGAFLLAFQNPVKTIKTEMIELTDSSGHVLTRIQPGSITLMNRSGAVKAEVTADDHNGNMTLRGDGDKRISMFMSDKVPLIVLYDDKGNPIASLPAAIK